jgi:hypothetical protein
MPDWQPTFDATVVTRILDAGGVITGKSGKILSSHTVRISLLVVQG